MNSHYESDHECVPFFGSKDEQIKFEFFYLIVLFFLICGTVALIAFGESNEALSQTTASALYSIFGGLLGGWAYDAKWFYRVTARGRHNQYKQVWQQHKFYWRILIPFVAGSIAFSVYCLLAAGLFVVQVEHANTGRVAFGLTFFFGYFSDLALSRIARWSEQMLPARNESTEK